MSIPGEGEQLVSEAGAKVRAFLSKYFRTYRLGDDEDIFGTKLINSMAAMDLVLFIERTFAIELEPADLQRDNFRTITAITAMIARKRQGTEHEWAPS